MFCAFTVSQARRYAGLPRAIHAAALLSVGGEFACKSNTRRSSAEFFPVLYASVGRNTCRVATLVTAYVLQ